MQLYLLNFGQFNRICRAIGGVIVLLWWLNWGSIALLLGAQLKRYPSSTAALSSLVDQYGIESKFH
ncbi:MAG: hypothetical protein EA001_12895 [Oscillatoriales cyanobacterium]|nr:MAG: hypothetical protein EA001_12895 [Oscillatoriales cyanobacterium]